MSIYTGEVVCHDGNIITANGPAAALPYAYELTRLFSAEEDVEALKEGMMFNRLMQG